MTALITESVSTERTAPAFTVTLHADDGTPQGWVVVDSLVQGWAMGGVRMTDDVNEAEVGGLARTMTRKLGLVGLPVGGAKGGIHWTGDGDREQRLREFGRTVAPLLHGGIHLGCDLGLGPADRAVFFEEAGYDPRRRPRAKPMEMDWRTYYEPLVDCTGHGVGEAALAMWEATSRSGPARVVVQGFGSVGRAVARFLSRRGHQIVAVADVLGTVVSDALPVDELIALTDSHGSIDRSALPSGVRTLTGPGQWLNVEADVLVLAANMHALNADNVGRLPTGIVIEGGNLSISPEAKRTMAGAGVTVVPDSVANVGGAAAAGLALTGVVPFGLPGPERKDWVFEWVGSRVRQNTLDLSDLVAAGVADPLAELLRIRRTDRPLDPAPATVVVP